jgi:hypothetical protein
MSALLKAGLLSVFFSQALASPIGQPSPAWYGPRPHGCKCGIILFLRQPTKCQKEPSAYPPFRDIIASRKYNSTDRIPPAGQCHDHNGCYNYESFACPSGGCNEFHPCEGCRLSQSDEGPQDFSLQGPGIQTPTPLDLTQLQDFDLSQNGGSQDQGPPAGGFQSAGPKDSSRPGGQPMGQAISQQQQDQQMQIPPVGPVTAKVSVDDIQLTPAMPTPATPPQGQPPHQGTQIDMPTSGPADCLFGLGQVNPGGPAQGQQPQLLQQTQQPQPQRQPGDPAQGQGVAVGGPGGAPDQRNHLILETWASKPSLLEPCCGSDQRRRESEDATSGKD